MLMTLGEALPPIMGAFLIKLMIKTEMFCEFTDFWLFPNQEKDQPHAF